MREGPSAGRGYRCYVQKAQHCGRATQSALRVGRALEGAVMRVTSALRGGEAQTISEQCAGWHFVHEPQAVLATATERRLGLAVICLRHRERIRQSATRITDAPSQRLRLSEPQKPAQWMSEAASKSQCEAWWCCMLDINLKWMSNSESQPGFTTFRSFPR